MGTRELVEVVALEEEVVSFVVGDTVDLRVRAVKLDEFQMTHDPLKETNQFLNTFQEHY